MFKQLALLKAQSFLRWFAPSSPSEVKASAEVPPPEPEDAESQFKCGQRCEKGQDDARAAEYYLKAAVQGHTAAQFKLGLIYARGRGVSRNGVSARQWLRQAAEQGHPGAQYHLGVHLYQDGKRLPQAEASEARMEGYKYVQLAVRQRYRAADSALEFIALGMPHQEVQEGGRRAAAFTEAPPRPVEPLPDMPPVEEEAI